jgi:predicted nucleic acid-binding protein
MNGNAISDRYLGCYYNIVDQESNLSFISEIELPVWTPENPKDLIVYQQFVANSTVYNVDDSIIAETIRIRKTYKIKLPDALIAATAIVHGFTLIADNDKDFLRITALKYINPKSVAG